MSLQSLPTEIRSHINSYLGRPRTSEAVLRIDPCYLLDQIRQYQPDFSLEGLLAYLIERDKIQKTNLATPGSLLYPITLSPSIVSFVLRNEGDYYTFSIASKRNIRIDALLAPVHPLDLSYSSHFDELYYYDGVFTCTDSTLVQELNYRAMISEPLLPELQPINDLYQADNGRVAITPSPIYLTHR